MISPLGSFAHPKPHATTRRSHHHVASRTRFSPVAGRRHTPAMSPLESEVRSFIGDNFLLADDAQKLAGSASLTRDGIVDSVGIVELLHFLETRYGIEIADDETVPANIDSIDNIVRYVSTKLATTASRADAGLRDARV